VVPPAVVPPGRPPVVVPPVVVVEPPGVVLERLRISSIDRTRGSVEVSIVSGSIDSN
jgi:hypothetical protein